MARFLAPRGMVVVSAPHYLFDRLCVARYRSLVIRSFRDRASEELYRSRVSVRFLAIAKVALRKLDSLDAATDLWRDLGLPGNHLEKLKGDRAAQHSVRINDQWRVCFRWDRGDAYDVEITDYH